MGRNNSVEKEQQTESLEKMRDQKSDSMIKDKETGKNLKKDKETMTEVTIERTPVEENQRKRLIEAKEGVLDREEDHFESEFFLKRVKSHQETDAKLFESLKGTKGESIGEERQRQSHLVQFKDQIIRQKEQENEFLKKEVNSPLPTVLFIQFQ